ncbi:MAG TPA: DNA repair protein RadC [Candidatus Paceibacterota bacterium]|nr:DNA repair protein RadC [Candidatus Paceibacterota bacterium]
MSTYLMRNNDLLLTTSTKKYVLKVRDLPNEEKPRERLLAYGPSALSAQELMAVLLSTGTTKEEVMQMSTRVMREYGERSLLSSTDPKQLAEELDIPIGKAMQIVAAGELGRRYFQKKRNGATVLRTSQDVFDYTADMRTLAKEHLRGLYLDTHYQVIHDEVLSIGTIDANLIHPREVFRPAIAHAAAAVVLVHNHPSGIVTPSEADRVVTLQVAEAGRVLGIDLIDHVVVTETDFVSIPVE